jgi:L-fucose isomerase-like protein
VGAVRCTREAGLTSLRAYLAMQELVEEQGLAGLAVGCYPRLMGVVCLAASLLGEEGVPVACEGDVNGAVAMLILTHLAHAPVHNTDMLDPIPAEDAIVFGHCGSGGFSLATSPAAVTLAPVRLMDRGVCCLFTARPGPVTLLNLVPALGGYRLGVLYGEALPTGMVFPGNPLKVRFGVGYAQVLEWIAAQGLGHHWMAAYGDCRRPVRDLAEMTSCGYSAL